MELRFKIFAGSEGVFYGGDAVENDLNYMGEWDFYGDYVGGNIVKWNGMYYIGNADSSLNQLLPTSYPQDWLLLNMGTAIEEPIGFDSFKSKIERGSEHGISAEVSVDSLGFYEVAAELIITAYNADIDSELVFRVEMKCSDTDMFSEIYRGSIDLSTYEDIVSDSCTVSCKVGEIGVRTTFNNRVETILNLHNGVMKNLDGVDLVSRVIAKEVVIPSKGINLTSQVAATENQVDDDSNLARPYIIPRLDNNGINEFEGANIFYNNQFSGWDLFWQFNNLTGKQITVAYNLKCLMQELEFHNGVSLTLKIDKELGGVISNIYTSDYITIYDQLEFELKDSLSAGDCDKIRLYFVMGEGEYHSSWRFTCLKDSYLSFIYLSIVAPSNCDLALAHETLSRATEVISGLTVKSDWYGRFNSGVNPLVAGMVGGGALKGLVKGLRLRNGDTNRINPTVINTSFKDLYLGLKAIDNIGWGFSEEGGELFIRVENWKWFYKNEVILTIDHPKEITRKLDEKSVYSRLKIGYAKYAAVEDINSVDTFHTERNYSSGLKAIDHEMSQLCKFVADPYAIEFTRRKSFDKTTKDWKYDENIFVFALKFESDLSWDGFYAVDIGVTGSSDTMISPETMINFRISPFRNACKFTDIVKQGNLTKTYNMTSGVGNVTAKGEPIVTAGTYYLEDPAEQNLVIENDSLFLQNQPILKPETLEFEYPLTVEEYNFVRVNPYGKIVVDGEVCYLKKIEYSFMDGLAKFELVPAVDSL